MGSRDPISQPRGAPIPRNISIGISFRSSFADLAVSIAQMSDNVTALISCFRGPILTIESEAQCANSIIVYPYLRHAFLMNPVRDRSFCPSRQSVGRYVMRDPQIIRYYFDVAPIKISKTTFRMRLDLPAFAFPRRIQKISHFGYRRIVPRFVCYRDVYPKSRLIRRRLTFLTH